MKYEKQIDEIDNQAAGLIRKFKALLEDRGLTKGQDKVTLEAYGSLLFWQRTELALMVKEFGKTNNY